MPPVLPRTVCTRRLDVDVVFMRNLLKVSERVAIWDYLTQTLATPFIVEKEIHNQNVYPGAN
ncbi:hypothetical protein KSF_100310 [Reticulibacter mediterranei]|uniref:Uncharacterized protein n=1 Tax=Reticulibacter mediterranei TaxID=2778369 RepID=A0A8J3N8R8_9CHLR|nr:hypothetical protein KSF_100310 [Reticulibacter mediterranei]